MHSKKHLNFNALKNLVLDRTARLPDNRQKSKARYSLQDCCMSAFAMMFFQDPSLLAFQQRLKHKMKKDNLRTLFNIQDIPADTQLRENLDEVESHLLEVLFADFFYPLQRGKQLEQMQFFNGMYLVSIDGTQYFTSENISCPNCLEKKSKKNGVRYSHQVVAATMVCPGVRQVLPLAPEPIQNSDGSSKQDCETNAGKRLIKKLRQTHPKLKIIITADSLYSKQPFVDLLKESGFSFILVAKQSDHQVLYQWFCDLKRLGDTQRLEYKDPKGRTHLYEWINQVPLNGTKDAENINYFEYTILDGKKVKYHNGWVTDISIDSDNIRQLVKGGRAKWKIENEAFNTLKNQGYHLEHNFGHGKKYLAYNFLLFNFLAFLLHQILELCDPLYQKCRESFSSRKEYWNQLRCTIRVIIFPRWSSLLKFVIDPESGVPP